MREALQFAGWVFLQIVPPRIAARIALGLALAAVLQIGTWAGFIVAPPMPK